MPSHTPLIIVKFTLVIMCVSEHMSEAFMLDTEKEIGY